MFKIVWGVAMHRGYIKLWRKVEDSGMLQMPQTLALFVFLLLKATHKPRKVGTPHGIVELETGQYISGRVALAAKLNQSEKQIRTGLGRLKSLGIISVKSASRFSVYSIVNYEKYQTEGQQEASTEASTEASIAANSGPAKGQQKATKQALKHLNIDSNTLSGKPDVPSPTEAKSKPNSAECGALLEYLNEKSGSHFKPVDSNLKLIQARINEGATTEEIKQVIDTKAAEWMSDEQMKIYLRPATLFSPKNYAQYSGQLGKSNAGCDFFGGCV